MSKDKYIQLTFFDVNALGIVLTPPILRSKLNKKIVTTTKKSNIIKKKKISIREAIPLALVILNKEFSAYINPYEKSLIGEIKDILNRPFVSDTSIMRRLRESGLAKCIDPIKSRYKQL